VLLSRLRTLGAAALVTCAALGTLAGGALEIAGATAPSGDFTPVRTVHDRQDFSGYLDLKKVSRGTVDRDGNEALAFSATTYGRWHARSLRRCPAGIGFSFPQLNRDVAIHYGRELHATIYRGLRRIRNVAIWRENLRSVAFQVPEVPFAGTDNRPRWHAYSASPPRRQCGERVALKIDQVRNHGIR
jgi:hypothetical protein